MRGGLTFPGRLASHWGAVRRILTRDKDGYTVIEIMVVLGVTAGLFVAAAVMIIGRQNQTAFEQAARQVQSQVQQVLNEVASGHYPFTGDFQCSVGAPPTLSPVAAGQGTNSGCIFLGRAIQFGIADTQPQQFSIYTVAGLRDYAVCSTENECLDNAYPTLVAPSAPLHDNPDYPDNSINEGLSGGLTVARMWYNDGSTDTEIGAFAFVNSLAHFGDTGEIVSGSGGVNVVAIDGTALDTAKLDAVHQMNSDGNNLMAAGTVNPVGGVFVCLDGGAEDYAIIQIGGESRDLSVQMITKDKGGSTCTL